MAPFARGMGSVVGDNLEVIIQPWLAATLRIGAGSIVFVDNRNGQFTIARRGANDDPDEDTIDLQPGDPS